MPELKTKLRNRLKLKLDPKLKSIASRFRFPFGPRVPSEFSQCLAKIVRKFYTRVFIQQ